MSSEDSLKQKETIMYQLMATELKIRRFSDNMEESESYSEANELREIANEVMQIKIMLSSHRLVDEIPF